MTLSSPARNVLTRPPAPRLSTLSHIQIASLWFALALGQGWGRQLAFKVLTRGADDLNG